MAQHPSPTGGPVVVGVDGSEESVAALRWAVEAARLRVVPLRVVHTWQYPQWLLGPGASTLPGPVDEMDAAAHGLIHRVLAGVDTHGVTIETAIVQGDIVSVLLDEAERAALVVLGRRGIGGVRRLLLGSVSSGVVHGAKCPVVILPHEVDA